MRPLVARFIDLRIYLPPCATFRLRLNSAHLPESFLSQTYRHHHHDNNLICPAWVFSIKPINTIERDTVLYGIIYYIVFMRVWSRVAPWFRSNVSKGATMEGPGLVPPTGSPTCKHTCFVRAQLDPGGTHKKKRSQKRLHLGNLWWNISKYLGIIFFRVSYRSISSEDG